MSLGFEGNGVGRPEELDEVKRAEICALLASGCSYRTAAKYVGCTASAISKCAKRDPEFAAQIEKAVAQREVILLSYVRASARRSWRAGAYLLETTVGGRFGGGHVSTLEEEVESERMEEALARVQQSIGSGVGIEVSGFGEEDLRGGGNGAGVEDKKPAVASSSVASAGVESSAVANEQPAAESAAAARVGAGEHAAAKGQSAGASATRNAVDALERSRRASTKPAVPGASGKRKSDGDAIRRSMDALERLWELQDQLEDDDFFDVKHCGT